MSFAAMVTVILIHSKTNGASAAAWDVFIQTLLNRGLSDWAVPFFFVASGYWFGVSTARLRFQEFILNGYVKLLQRKYKTLFLPYIAWCLIGAMLQLPLVCFNNHVKHTPLFSRIVFAADGFWDFINNLFGITHIGPVGNMPLWFMRVLLFFFLFSPAWILLRQWMPKKMVLGIGVLMVLFQLNVPSISLSLGSIGWMLIGLGLAEFNLSCNARRPILTCILFGVVYVACAIFESLSMAGWVDLGHARIVFKRLIPFAGIPFWWMLYDLILRCCRRIPALKIDTFWIYCIHQCFTAYTIAAGFYVLGKSDSVCICLMFVALVVGLTMSLWTSVLVKRILPSAHSFLVGGRVVAGT